MAMTTVETIVLFHSPERSSWKITFSVIPYSSALLQPARDLWLQFGGCVSSADRIKATGKASLGTLVLKGRLGKMWALFGRKWESWLPGACRRLRFSMAFLLWSSPVSAAATAPKPQTKAGSEKKKNHPQ